ncbi:uncharacterized protein Bfra_008156 [Botrytis fragariae]|uniref:Uncharacterized protein n=1 Tax=Botrytis fragariae TaxID=1964551 RepID=A0A8H6EIA0_9HELO|nr:uncharacterized protein Bfra_008156 [Botrytis fragariae]KAF5872880.1 hypothetical protein Bfra_008156 [Botrytis fragariae]
MSCISRGGDHINKSTWKPSEETRMNCIKDQGYFYGGGFPIPATKSGAKWIQAFGLASPDKEARKVMKLYPMCNSTKFAR